MSKDKSKYNSSSKSAEWFPYKKRIFNSNNHPVIQSKEKCSYKTEALLSFQERQMFDGVISSLQCNERDALRISIHTLSQQVTPTTIQTVECAKAGTKEQGHTSRSIPLSVRITKEDQLNLKSIAKVNSQSIKEAIRTTIIWMANGIKDESISKITGCSELNQDDKAKEWKANQKEITKHPSTQRLKEVRQFWKEEYEEKNAWSEEKEKLNRDERLARRVGIPLWEDVIEDRFKKIIEEQEVEPDLLDIDARQVYWIMAQYQVDYETAVLFFEDEQRELEAIANMTPYELVQHLKKKKEEDAEFSKEWEAEQKKKRLEKDAKDRYERRYKQIVEDGKYEELLHHTLTELDKEIILSNNIRTEEELEEDIRVSQQSYDDLIELRRKEKEEYDKAKIRDIKEGRIESPSPIDMWWHSSDTKKLWDTYDEWK